ncbi:hypothetical protein FHR47_001182 [Xanthomonas arboricola]|uniref:Uncharacterized protein n=1 Tax=Xanthomonas cannabis TaxID=1885674 RepID=A0ABR6JLN2_9XANT|nr:hypothetical protein [Xanthomonas cannabis]MBB4593734.1 hypothetical protein [Xanthomonas cannabis]MBB5522306.1 hypothetical protein [Xanthomonas cannabis]NIK00534.1 hypothetical protein [Xanthomonas cannabis]NIK63334.1 hypothetical protein [Xanthomonas cannabis]
MCHPVFVCAGRNTSQLLLLSKQINGAMPFVTSVRPPPTRIVGESQRGSP